MYTIQNTKNKTLTFPQVLRCACNFNNFSSNAFTRFSLSLTLDWFPSEIFPLTELCNSCCACWALVRCLWLIWNWVCFSCTVSQYDVSKSQKTFRTKVIILGVLPSSSSGFRTPNWLRRKWRIWPSNVKSDISIGLAVRNFYRTNYINSYRELDIIIK